MTPSFPSSSSSSSSSFGDGQTPWGSHHGARRRGRPIQYRSRIPGARDGASRANSHARSMISRMKMIGGACARGMGTVNAASAAVALGASAFGGGYHARPRSRRAPQAEGPFQNPDRVCTDAIMATTVAAYALQVLSGQALTAVGAKVNASIAAGQMWRLVTPIALHGGLSHLLVNMYSLNSIGPMMEATFGREQFMAVYLGAGVAGNYASYRFCPSNSVGASGAIFGLAGALAVYLQRHKRYLGERADMQLQSLGTALAVNTMFGLTSRRIDNWGHGGGLVGGALLAYLNGPNLKLENDIDARAGKSSVRRRKLVNRPVLSSAIDSVRRFWEDDDDAWAD